MNQEFNTAANVHINRDSAGIVRELLHTEEHFISQARTPQLAAAEYLAKYGKLLGIVPQETTNLSLTAEADPTETSGELRFRHEKHQFDMTTVGYQQTHYGLPIWQAGEAIHMKNGPYRIVSSQSSRHADVTVKRPDAAVLTRLKKLDEATLAQHLGLSGDKNYDAQSLKIGNIQLIIYRYEQAKRMMIEKAPADEHTFGHNHSNLPLPPVPAGIGEGKHYVCAEVHFALVPHGHSMLNWVAIVEAETLSVLYLRAFVDNVNGMVFQNEPSTDNGGPAPTANNAALNPIRTSVLLPDLMPPVGGQQALSGSIVKLMEVELPTVAAPTEPVGTDFNFNARTDNFAAVNAYYHCDKFFQLMQSLGFNVASYCGGTTFPTPVDHRGFGGNFINAHCLGNAGGGGIGSTSFGLADLSDVVNPLGIACDYRVVLHELGGHGILYNHVHSANFGFSHSAGDSIAAITCAPESQAADPFLTFPWVGATIGRRHDRTPAAGWGWGGNIATHPFDSVLDYGGYNNEQILCTTLFRFYLSIGGGSVDIPMRHFASRYAVYLILRAIATLTPATNPGNASGFATALMTADLGDWTSEGQAGGAYGKVIRWAFEKQGLYQPAGTSTPNNNVGAPPPVDVYIDDGRHGEYPYQPNWWSTQSIWNRRHADGLTTHEEPIVGVPNFAYVKIKNRGTQIANNVIVKGYHANPAAGLVYPNDWTPMTTAQLPAANVPPNSATEIIVGPFQWTPTVLGHECLFMVVSATGDASNISNMSAGDSIPEWRLVPNDNNIGQRNVFPVAGGGGLKGLVAALEGTKIVIKNPLHDAARVVITAVLPRFLVAYGWQVVFTNPGAGAFALRPGETKTIVLSLKAGKEFTTDEVIRAKDAVIHIEARTNGILVGGMSYTLDPKILTPGK